MRINALCRLIDAVNFELEAVAGPLRVGLAGHTGYQAIQTIPGIGPVLAAIFVAEIGEGYRFPGPAHLSSWAGLTPRHRESDTVVHRGPITKQGSTLVRWAPSRPLKEPATPAGSTPPATRSASGTAGTSPPSPVARKLLTLIYYGLREGHIRALANKAG
jgi:hypothetical protein